MAEVTSVRDRLLAYIDEQLAVCEKATTPGPWEVWDGPEYQGGGRDLCIGAGEKWLFNMEHRNCEARDHHWGLCKLEPSTGIADTGQTCPECLSDEKLKVGPPFPDCQHAEIITTEQRANADLIAAARTHWPLVLKALRGEVEAHSDFGIYEDCGHGHDLGEGVFDIDDVGLVCEEGLIQTICRECDTDDGEVREDSDTGEWPCPTIRRIAQALGIEEGAS